MIDHVLNDASQLDEFRPLLTVLARRLLGTRLRQKYDETDLVQQTLLDAFRHREQFRGHSDSEIQDWLRTILYHNVFDVHRKFTSAKRDYDREIRLSRESDGTSHRCCVEFVADCRSPDQHCELQESIERLKNALRKLTPDQREAIELYYLQELSVTEVATRMHRSAQAIHALRFRGVSRLQAILKE